jgi:YD repeat-containing protein
MSSGKDLSIAILVDRTPSEVYNAVNNVRGWWSGEITGTTDELGAEWTYRYQDLHRSTQKITEMVPGKKVVWHVTNSHLSFVKDAAEWNGTDIVFDIAQKGKQTELRFTHVGLMPSIECYNDCSDAWGFYIRESLHSLITTGKGKPNPTE